MDSWQPLREFARQVASDIPFTESRTVQVRRQVEEVIGRFFGLVKTRQIRTVTRQDMVRHPVEVRLVKSAAQRVVDDNGRWEGPLDGDYCSGWSLGLRGDGQLLFATWTVEGPGLYPSYVPPIERIPSGHWHVATSEELASADMSWTIREDGENRRGGTRWVIYHPDEDVTSRGASIMDALRNLRAQGAASEGRDR